MRNVLLVLLCSLVSLPVLGNLEDIRAAAGEAMAAGEYGVAIEKYRRILREAPEDGAAHYQLGIALMDGAGDLDGSIAAFDRAVELEFQPIGAAYRLSRIYARSGKTTEALKQLDIMVTGGFATPNLIEGQADYDNIAAEPGFSAALEQIRAARFPCKTSTDHRAFDFWVGQWNVTQNSQFAGTNNIQAMLGNCVLFEEWESATGGEGKSFSFYDSSTEKWRQLWVTDSGTVIDFVGEARDDGIFYTAETKDAADGGITHHRFEFTPNDDGSVRQHWLTSTDQENWATIWDGRYEKAGNEP